jgi:hypothetical protein
MVDLATDINMILVYFGEEGQEGYGWMMLGMVLASMGLQLVLVVVQNGKAGWRKLMGEVLIVVSGLKPGECERASEGVFEGRRCSPSLRTLAMLFAPGFDAMRVVSNADIEEYQLMDAKMELAATKAVEMFCESIPGESLIVAAGGSSRDSAANLPNHVLGRLYPAGDRLD